MHKVAVIVGSIRKESINKKLAHAVARLAEGRLEMAILQIDDLPLFNQDNETDPPPPVGRLKAEIRATDGLLFVTPEHNRSIPAALKNAIDWASRPPKEGVLTGKVGAIMGTSRGRISTAVAQSHLRTILECNLFALLGAPEAYIQFTDALLDEGGGIADESAKKLLNRFIDGLARLVASAK